MENPVFNYTRGDHDRREALARRAKISYKLVHILENGGVTHPKIAKRLGRILGLSAKVTEELMPENRRPSSPYYDPLKYMEKSERIQEKVRRILSSHTEAFSISEISDAMEIAEEGVLSMVAKGLFSMDENGRIDAEQAKNEIIRLKNRIFMESFSQDEGSPYWLSDAIESSTYDAKVKSALKMIRG